MTDSALSDWPKTIERLWAESGEHGSLTVETVSGRTYIITEGPIVLHPDAVEFVDADGAKADVPYAELESVVVNP